MAIRSATALDTSAVTVSSALCTAFMSSSASVSNPNKPNKLLLRCFLGSGVFVFITVPIPFNWLSSSFISASSRFFSKSVESLLNFFIAFNFSNCSFNWFCSRC